MAKKANGKPAPTGTKEVEIKVALDPNVLEFKRNKLIDVDREIDQLTAKKREVGAEWTSKIKDKKEQRTALLEELESGRQKMTVHVIEERDDRRAHMIIKRADTGAVVDERPMTQAERQLDIESHIAQKAKPARKPRTPRVPRARAAEAEA